ncbi:centromere protein U isoform X2 [Apodemus sylvaticus]|uniref:centromere protein U isoform X2 n=1 Tax=Apodemus sylvaticus TaxID=10129 RepID=UPI002242E612|nr:centromere protein U isoform X2 [Apodemus sylvaticus]
MAAQRSLSAKHPGSTLGNTYSRKQKAGQKAKDVFDFSNNSDVSSMLGELEEEGDPSETFDPPLHSTAIYTEDELSKHCVSSTPPATHGGRKTSNSNPSENEASGAESIKLSAKKPRRLESNSGELDSSEANVRSEASTVGRRSRRPQAAPAALSPPERPAEPVTPRRTRLHSAQPSAVQETPATQSQLKTQKKVRLSPGRRKTPRSGATDSDASESIHMWCLEGKRQSDIMELDVVLSVFEKAFLEYKQRVESESCNQAINKFYFKIKGELIRMLKEVQMLKALKRKNTKIISDMEKKRQRLIEVQDELIRLEPQLKPLQTKYAELKERKSSLKNSKHFLSNLKQLYQDYSNVREEGPREKDKYDSSSLPALLFKARSILGAENHLRTINCQLGKLLEQD